MVAGWVFSRNEIQELVDSLSLKRLTSNENLKFCFEDSVISTAVGVTYITEKVIESPVGKFEK